jgi:transposase
VEIIYPRVAGLDVGKREVAVTVRMPGDVPGQRRQEVRKYKTFYPVLRQMVAWLVEEGVTHIAMEATGVYGKPVFHALCEAEQIEVLLVNARHAKNVPGRKTDVKTVSGWLSCWNAACCGGVSSRPKRSPRSGNSPATARS